MAGWRLSATDLAEAGRLARRSSHPALGRLFCCVEAVQGTAFRGWLELACFRVADQETASCDGEIGTVDLQFAAFNKDAHARKGHQVTQAEFNRREFKTPQIVGVGMVAWLEAFSGRLDLRHPASNEVTG